MKNFGYGLQLPSDVYHFCKLTLRSILKHSKNEDIKNLYHLTSYKNINTDIIISSSDKTKKPKSIMQNQIENEINTNFLQLKEQSGMIIHLKEEITKKGVETWNMLIKYLPPNIFNFCRKSLIYSLTNNSNLFRWKRSNSDKCELCQKKQTQLHVLNNCTVAVRDGRYNWRHDSILSTLVNYMSYLSQHGFKMYADLNGFRSPSELFKSYRPDIVLRKNDKLFIFELTVCFETNTLKSRNYKINRYKDIEKDAVAPLYVAEKYFIEITSIGFITKSIQPFQRFCKLYKINTERMMKKASETAIRASFYIFNRRNKEWTNPELLNFT